MVKKTTMHKFVTRQGYELVEKFGKKKTSELLKISRPTIDAILKKHPQEPTKTLPKYVFQWEETAGNRMFVEKYQGSLRAFSKYVYEGMKAWLFLGKKDPISWGIEDFRKIWKAEEFRDVETGRIRFNDAVLFRKWMRAIGQAPLCSLEEFSTKGLKRPIGLRKQWFLEDDEIGALIEAIEREDLLVAFVLSLLSGGRASSVMRCQGSRGVRPLDIDEKNNGIIMFEPKRSHYVTRLFHPKVIELVKRYIHDEGIKPNQALFLGYCMMRSFLEETARKARVSKISEMRGTWHITKHTFVSQGAYHGLSLEVISEQTGTDANTLLEYYAGIKEKKLRTELLGEKVEIEPFHKWALKVIIEPAILRYEGLKVKKGEICHSVTSY